MYYVRSNLHVTGAWLHVFPDYVQWMYFVKHGTVFETEADAKAHAEKWLPEYKGKPLEPGDYSVIEVSTMIGKEYGQNF